MKNVYDAREVIAVGRYGFAPSNDYDSVPFQFDTKEMLKGILTKE